MLPAHHRQQRCSQIANNDAADATGGRSWPTTPTAYHWRTTKSCPTWHISAADTAGTLLPRTQLAHHRRQRCWHITSTMADNAAGTLPPPPPAGTSLPPTPLEHHIHHGRQRRWHIAAVDARWHITAADAAGTTPPPMPLAHYRRQRRWHITANNATGTSPPTTPLAQYRHQRCSFAHHCQGC